ncbi:MAG TPA: hypothetical protein VG497_06840 [Kribbella sp.]|nr:hypothetical protein [Kribbella sp.]
MTAITRLRQEIDRWEADLASIAETSASDSWFLEERRLAEAQHTLVAFRGRILPALAAEAHDAIVVDELEHLLDGLEDLRNDLLRTVHPIESHRAIADTVAALRALTKLSARLERSQPA